jgi:hypothetical protein
MEVSGHLQAPVHNWIAGWLGPRTGLDSVVKRKIPSLYRDSNLMIIQSVTQRYTTEISRLLLKVLYNVK